MTAMPVRLAVRGRQRGVERAGLVVVGEAERFAVERYAQRGERAAVHGVKDLAGQAVPSSERETEISGAAVSLMPSRAATS